MLALGRGDAPGKWCSLSLMSVERPPEQRAATVFRWPAPLQPSESVVVGAEDACVSVQRGTVLGVFSPGTHQLPAVIPEGVELWFCATRGPMVERFGGRLPGGPMVFGEYAYRVVAPHQVVLELAVGGDAGQFTPLLGRTLMNALGGELGMHPAGTPIPDAVLERAGAKLNAEWARLGVRFEGFRSVGVR